MAGGGSAPPGGHYGSASSLTLNGQVGSVTDPIEVVGASTTGATNIASIASAALSPGAWAYSTALDRYYRLQATVGTVDGINIINANGLPGFQWVAQVWRSALWAGTTSFTVNTTTGNDENAGTVGAPLLTLSEVARRLAYAYNLPSISVTIIGNQSATDVAVFSCTMNYQTFATLSITYTPTTIYSGTVTAYTGTGAAPSTADSSLQDTGVTGGSFTAAGLMANGVLCSTTSGTSSQFWLAKDKGATTARTSIPFTGSGDTTLTVGQTYHAQQLSTATSFRWMDGWNQTSVIVFNAYYPTSAQGAFWDQGILFETCWFQQWRGLAPALINCAFQGASTFYGTGTNGQGFILNSGMMKGTGATQFALFNSVSAQTNYGLVLQGATFEIQTSMITIQGNLWLYDNTSTLGPLQAIYWGIIYISSSIGGSNNTFLFFANKMSMMGHELATAAFWLAGTSTTSACIQIAGRAAITVASEGTGGGNQDATQNGVFQTA